MKARSKTYSLKAALILGFTVATLCGFGSCSVSLDEICRSKLPEFEQTLEAAQAALIPWAGSGGGGSTREITRSLASAGQEMALLDRKSWGSWAMLRLTETQHYMDVIEDDARYLGLKKELSAVATELVSFHGYTAEGNAVKMTATLARARSRTHELTLRSCGAEYISARPRHSP